MKSDGNIGRGFDESHQANEKKKKVAKHFFKITDFLRERLENVIYAIASTTCLKIIKNHVHSSVYTLRIYIFRSLHFIGS